MDIIEVGDEISVRSESENEEVLPSELINVTVSETGKEMFECTHKDCCVDSSTRNFSENGDRMMPAYTQLHLVHESYVFNGRLCMADIYPPTQAFCLQQ